LYRLLHLDSASIDRIAYDEETRRLYVRFAESGDTYLYHDVEPDVHEELVAAESPGRYLNAVIKGKYFYERLSNRRSRAS
jgi:hypothetical protein